MKEYTPSASLQEMKQRFPFPWREERVMVPGSLVVRLIDAQGREVPIFEMTALCRLVTEAQASRDQQDKSSVSEEGKE